MAHAKTTLIPLYAEADEPRVRPVLDALRQKRFSVSDDAQNPKTDGIVLFFLSENIGNDAAAIDRFLALDARKAEIIPVNLDGSTPPAPIGNAIMARNTIFAERYSVEELAGRIADAAAKPAAAVSKTRNWIIAAAAAAVLALIGIVLWRVIPKGSEPAAAEATPATTAEPRIPQAAGISAEELGELRRKTAGRASARSILQTVPKKTGSRTGTAKRTGTRLNAPRGTISTFCGT